MLEELYKTQKDKLLKRVNRVINNTAISEEVLQDAFLKAHLNLDKFDGDKSSLKTWFTYILMSCAWDVKRKDQRTINTVPLEEFVEQGSISRVTPEELYSAIKSIDNPDHQKIVYNLAVLGYSYKDLSTICKTSESNVRKIWGRFKLKLEQEYNARI